MKVEKIVFEDKKNTFPKKNHIEELRAEDINAFKKAINNHAGILDSLLKKSTILIEGSEFTYKAINGNIDNVKPGDLALNGIVSSGVLGKVLIYIGGNAELFSSWKIKESVKIN